MGQHKGSTLSPIFLNFERKNVMRNFLIILFLAVSCFVIGCGPGMRSRRTTYVVPTHRSTPTYRAPTHRAPTRFSTPTYRIPSRGPVRR